MCSGSSSPSSNQFGSQLVHHLQGLQIIPADLVGDITGAAKHAFVHDIQNPIRVTTAPIQQGKGHGESSPGRVTVEIVIGNAWAAFGKSGAFDMIERHPFAVRTLAASFHIRFVIF